MMEENVVSKAGTSFRITMDEIEELITEAGFEPRTRNNWYALTGN
jgi:cyclic dehypoxanthinyl futalosine synthase